MNGETDLTKLKASLEPSLSDDVYVYATVRGRMSELGLMEPWGLVSESEGITVIVEKAKADKCRLSYQGTFKRITLTVHSSLDAVGLTAVVATKLAEHGVSANVIAGYYHDHIFVQEGKAGLAMEAIEGLVDQYRAKNGSQ